MTVRLMVLVQLLEEEGIDGVRVIKVHYAYY
jgi:hypothetical protein